MDPLAADKLLVCSAMICMIEVDKLPAWVVIIIGREFIIWRFPSDRARNGIVIAANYWGKFKTVSQMIRSYDHTSDATGFPEVFLQC